MGFSPEILVMSIIRKRRGPKCSFILNLLVTIFGKYWAKKGNDYFFSEIGIEIDYLKK